MHWGIMGYHGICMGYVWLCMVMVTSIGICCEPAGISSAHDQRRDLPTWSFWSRSREARTAWHVGHNASQVPKLWKLGHNCSEMSYHTIPYPITSTMGTTWPIWCDGRSVFRCRWTILWLITPITPIYGYLCGMLRISTHSTRPVPNWTRGPCETAPWWLLRCGLQCRGRRTSSGRHHGMISKYTLW